jgi:hypothetical protein
MKNTDNKAFWKAEQVKTNSVDEYMKMDLKNKKILTTRI